MKILVACEFSGTVREAFNKRGHDVWSCDLLDTEIPGNHIKGDVLKILNDGWDMMIAHPPCTHLAVSGARWFKNKQKEQKEAFRFCRILLDSPIGKIALENPVSIISTRIRKPDQIIQPWMFGDEYTKTTCLWLKNLPILSPTNIVGKGEVVTFKSGKRMSKWMANSFGNGHLRSKTFQGIADALALQYTAFVNSKLTVSEWNIKFDKIDIDKRNGLMLEYL